MNTTFDQKIIIEDASNHQNITVYITIKASESILIDKITGMVFLEARGRMSGQKKKIVFFEIAKQQNIPKNELVKIPFSFKLPESRIDSYEGKNVSFSYSCEAKTYVNKEDIDKVDRGLFTKKKSFVTSDDSIKVEDYFLVESAVSDYQIIESKSDFYFKFNYFILTIVAFLFGGMYLFYVPEYTGLYIIIGVLFVALMTILTNRFVENILGDVTMETLGTEEGFLCKLNKTGNFNLTNQKIFYEIIEEVVDDRGTSSTTYEKVIYKSEVKKLPEFKDASSLTFFYPKRDGLYSTKLGDASIIWNMNLQGSTYFGIVLKYNCEFTVERK